MSSKTVWSISLILLVTWAPPARASEDDALLPRAHGVGAPANDGGSRTLKVLYGSYTTLQVLDVTSTLEALNQRRDRDEPRRPGDRWGDGEVCSAEGRNGSCGHRVELIFGQKEQGRGHRHDGRPERCDRGGGRAQHAHRQAISGVRNVASTW